MDSTPRLVLVIRRSREYWIHNHVNLLDQLSSEEAELAIPKLDWWQRNFPISYVEFRHALRRIAVATYEGNTFDEIICWSDQEAVERQPENTFLFPIDEDDWLRPDTSTEIRNLLQDTPDLCRWSVARKQFNGEFSIDPHPFVESCGYVLRLPCPWLTVVDHMSVPSVPLRSKQILTFRNQTPASIGLFLGQSIEDIEAGLSTARRALPELLPVPFRNPWNQYHELLDQLLSSRESRLSSL